MHTFFPSRVMSKRSSRKAHSLFDDNEYSFFETDGGCSQLVRPQPVRRTSFLFVRYLIRPKAMWTPVECSARPSGREWKMCRIVKDLEERAISIELRRYIGPSALLTSWFVCSRFDPHRSGSDLHEPSLARFQDNRLRHSKQGDRGDLEVRKVRCSSGPQ